MIFRITVEDNSFNNYFGAILENRLSEVLSGKKSHEIRFQTEAARSKFINDKMNHNEAVLALRRGDVSTEQINLVTNNIKNNIIDMIRESTFDFDTQTLLIEKLEVSYREAFKPEWENETSFYIIVTGGKKIWINQ